MRIIRATKNEVPDIVTLNAHVQKIHREMHPKIFKPVANDRSIHGFFEYLIDQDTNVFRIAYIESLPVGYVWYAVEEKPDFPMKYGRKQIFIHQIAVNKDFRRKKVGKSLFDEIEKEAKILGINHIELDTWAFNTEAQNFFDSLGFETYNIKMWRRT